MGFKPTKAQYDAIHQNGNILVSAAAGSGKTAVLVERVIQKLKNKENPTSADELLIVTFTNAAAGEMRTRIERRIEEECRKNPDDVALLLQKHLLNNSKICTIDSFCIDLVRENFDKLGISPDFKIVEDTDLQEINHEVLYSIINRYFEQENNDFFELLDVIGSEFDERNFVELLLSVYEFSRQMPFPKQWYSEILDNYNEGNFSSENLWYKYAFNKARTVTKALYNDIINAKMLIYNIEKAGEAYSKAFSAAEEIISDLKEKAFKDDWNEFYNALREYSLPKLPVVRGVGDILEVITVKDIYKHISGKALGPLFKIFYGDLELINSQFKKLYPLIKLFVDILTEFDQKVFEAYKENNVFTFHNTEHLALELLCKFENGEVLVTDNGREILEQYKEIMVDEYQDTNDLQNMLFYILSDYDKRLFAVGDVKQSIYAFRGANPENFLSKKNSYALLENADNNDSKKIILGNNFRSKDNICDFVNSFFEIFMNTDTGNIVYDDEEKLLPTSVFPKTDLPSVSFDFIDCAYTKGDKLCLEARSIADFINNTVNGPECIKIDENNLRKAEYGDFTILLRSLSNKAPRLVKELEGFGIPVSLSLHNFSESIEIQTFLSLLRIIDNPKNDIALATVLLSNIFSFSTEKLAKIRADYPKGDLFSALIYSAEQNDEEVKLFLRKIEEYRLKSVTLPLSKLISFLLYDTEYLNIVLVLDGNEQRRNNLLLLNELASQFVSNKPHSLSAFCDYVLKLSNSGSASKNKNAVNIMSIHASKGLQFPICIIANTASRFNDAESRSSAAYSTRYGIGFKYYDEQAREKISTVSREVILDNIKSSQLEEELRLLYVAMTRAEDRLHFVGSFDNFEKTICNINNLIFGREKIIDYNIFSRTKAYSDWLLLCLMINPSYSTLLRCYPDKTLLSNDKININIINGEYLKSACIIKDNIEAEPDFDFVEAINGNIKYCYPYQRLCDIESKISVSRLANKAESEKYAFSLKPSFISKDGVTPAGRGSAMHKVIEFFDFSKYYDVEGEIERLYEWQFLSEDEIKSLSIKALKSFFESEVFERIKNADRVEREMRFLTEISTCEIDASLPLELKNEKLTVQGAVDICFIENNELIILDFKTDRIDSMDELVDSYSEQLNAYAKACEKIFNLKVKEKIIYSFAKSEAISIN